MIGSESRPDCIVDVLLRLEAESLCVSLLGFRWLTRGHRQSSSAGLILRGVLLRQRHGGQGLASSGGLSLLKSSSRPIKRVAHRFQVQFNNPATPIGGRAFSAVSGHAIRGSARTVDICLLLPLGKPRRRFGAQRDYRRVYPAREPASGTSWRTTTRSADRPSGDIRLFRRHKGRCRFPPPRRATRPSGKSASSAKVTIPGVSKTGHDVSAAVQLRVDLCCEDLNVRVSIAQLMQSGRATHETNESDGTRATIL